MRYRNDPQKVIVGAIIFIVLVVFMVLTRHQVNWLNIGTSVGRGILEGLEDVDWSTDSSDEGDDSSDSDGGGDGGDAKIVIQTDCFAKVLFLDNAWIVLRYHLEETV